MCFLERDKHKTRKKQTKYTTPSYCARLQMAIKPCREQCTSACTNQGEFLLNAGSRRQHGEKAVGKFGGILGDIKCKCPQRKGIALVKAYFVLSIFCFLNIDHLSVEVKVHIPSSDVSSVSPSSERIDFRVSLTHRRRRSSTVSSETTEPPLFKGLVTNPVGNEILI